MDCVRNNTLLSSSNCLPSHQINSTLGSFLKGISSLRRKLYSPSEEIHPKLDFPSNSPCLCVHRSFAKVTGFGESGVRLKIQFSSEGNNKFSFRRPKDELWEHFNSFKRLDFILRGVFILQTIETARSTIENFILNVYLI